MSFEIDGTTWLPQSASEHTAQIMSKINSLLQENNVKDSDGNIVQLKQNYANALYLLALGEGQRFSDNDEKLSAAINSFNIELCDDTQIENLLPIAAITRNPGSYSTLRLTVTATDDGECTIPEGTKAPYGDVNFIVQTKVVISAGSSQIIETVCDTIGPVAVLSGEVNSFEGQIVNLKTVINNESSVPGVSAETTNDLRKRLISGDTIKYSLNGCKEALEELTGVTYARIYFNYYNSDTMELAGGVVLQPRTAYIVIHGSSDKIAEVYTSYMNAPTQNAPEAKGSYSTVKISVTAKEEGNAILSEGTSATYEGHKFIIDTATTVNAGESLEVNFTCDTWGPYEVPARGITNLDQTIENVKTATNLNASIPGTYDPKHVQNWVSSSGQAIPIYYDDASEKNVFVKVVLKEDAENTTQVENQIKRDLIVSSAQWKIGEGVTQLLTSAPFVDCTYTQVAYTQVSLDGVNWTETIEVGCNVIPRVSDGTIEIAQLGDE